MPPAIPPAMKAPSRHSTPILFLLGQLIGILLWSERIDTPTRWTILLMLLALTALWGHPGWSRQTSRLAVLSGFLLGLLSLFWGQTPQSTLPEDPTQSSRTLEATVMEAETREDGQKLLLDQVRFANGTPLEGKALLSVYRNPASLLPGDRVRLEAKLQPPGNYRTPGAFDYAGYLLREGITASGNVSGNVTLLGNTGQWTLNRWRSTIAKQLENLVPRSQLGLAEAMLVGFRGHLGEMSSGLQAAGIYHLIAISGSHISMVAGWSFFLLRLLLVLLAFPLARRMDMKPVTAWLTLIPVLLYGSLAGWSVATQRSVIMCCLLLLAVGLRRENQMVRALLLAAIALLAWHPWQWADAGFQLSFMATALTLVCWRALQHLTGWRKHLVMLLSSVLFLEVLLAPVSVYNFHRLTPWGILTNLLAIPWTGLVSLPLGLTGLLAGAFSENLQQWLWQAFATSLLPLAWMAETVPELPGGWWRLAGPTLSGLALFHVALAALPKARHIAFRLSLAGLMFLGLLWPRSSTLGGDFQAAILDIGQGQSVVLHTGDGLWSVLDAGGPHSPRFDIGEGVVSPFLWDNEVSRLRRVIISHPQMDHMSGAKSLLRNFQVEELWIGLFREEEANNAHYRELLQTAEKVGTRIRRLEGPFQLEDPLAKWTLLKPALPSHPDLNNRSLIWKLEVGRFAFLFPADLLASGERALLARKDLEPVTVMLAPHHGSHSSSSREFVATLRPRHVLFSAGRHNRFHHPHPEVEKRYVESGATPWRTDRQGTLLMRSDGQVLTLFPALYD
ncbi:MAG: DNA internalization-related competence protein ComEC/Rec2 [Magnetococcales bacterium]|nr:DNA internalization-related competence protein ComEC/Rec2 [Magnetococcales bacterium]